MKSIDSRQWPGWVLSLFSGFFSAVFLFMDRGAQVVCTETLLNSLHGDQLTLFLAMVLLTILFHQVYQPHPRRAAVFAAIGAAVFTLFYFVGHHIYVLDSLTRPSVNLFSLTADGISILGSFLLFYGLLVLLFHWILKHPLAPADQESRWLGCSRRSFLFCFCVPMAVCLLVFLLFYPGITSLDSFVQIAEALEILPLSDAHPFLHTLIIRAVLKLGLLIFGKIPSAIALYTLFQCTLISLCVAWVMVYMAKNRISLWIRIGTLIYFSAHPAIACYSVTLWKDVWISYFTLLYILFLIEILFHPDRFFQKKRNLISFLLVILGVMFTKNTGIAIIGLTLPFLLFFCRHYRKQILLVLVLSLSVLTLVRFVIIPGCGVIRGEVGEILSIPMQQVARACKKNPDSITEEQKACISQVLPYDQLPELYAPYLSDPVKQTFNSKAFSQDPARYAACWREIGRDNPRAYWEAFLANSCGYWYPDIVYWQVSPFGYYDGPLITGAWEFTDPDAESYTHGQANIQRRQYAVHLYTLLQTAPVISTLLSVASYFWAEFILLLIALMKKRYRMVLPFLVIGAVWLTCILSPVIAEFRYAFPAVVSLPLLAAFTLQDPCKAPQK